MGYFWFSCVLWLTKGKKRILRSFSDVLQSPLDIRVEGGRQFVEKRVNWTGVNGSVRSLRYFKLRWHFFFSLHCSKGFGVTDLLLCFSALTVFNFTLYQPQLCLSASCSGVKATPRDKLCQTPRWFIKIWFLWRTLMSGGKKIHRRCLPAPGSICSPFQFLKVNAKKRRTVQICVGFPVFVVEIEFFYRFLFP